MCKTSHFIALALAFAMTACGDLDSAVESFIASQGVPVHAQEIAAAQEAVESALDEASADHAEAVEAPEVGIIFDGDASISESFHDDRPNGEELEEPRFEQLNEDRNGNGILDPSEDIDDDGRLDLGIEDLDQDGHFDNIPEDENGNGVLDDGEDIDNDNRLDPGTEDLDGDGHFDNVNEDVNNNGLLDPSEDIDGDGELDVPEGTTTGDESDTPSEDLSEFPVEEDMPEEDPVEDHDTFFGDDGLPIHGDADHHEPSNDIEPDLEEATAEGHRESTDDGADDGTDDGTDPDDESHHEIDHGDDDDDEDGESGCSSNP